PSLLEMPPRQGERPVNDDLFTQRRRYDVGQPREGPEDALGHESPQGIEQQLLPHQRDTTANDDSPWAEESDDVTDRFRQRISRQAESTAANGISLFCGLCNQARRDWAPPLELRECGAPLVIPLQNIADVSSHPPA